MLVEDFLMRLDSAPQRLARTSYRDEFDLLAHDASRMIEGNFVREEDSDGNHWAPHAPATIAKHGVHDLLRLTGAMYAAAINPDDLRAVKELDDRGVTFGVSGTDIPYADIQNEGGGRIPQREYMYLRDQDREAVVELFQRRAAGRFWEAILG